MTMNMKLDKIPRCCCCCNLLTLLTTSLKGFDNLHGLQYFSILHLLLTVSTQYTS